MGLETNAERYGERRLCDGPCSKCGHRHVHTEYGFCLSGDLEQVGGDPPKEPLPPHVVYIPDDATNYCPCPYPHGVQG